MYLQSPTYKALLAHANRLGKESTAFKLVNAVRKHKQRSQSTSTPLPDLVAAFESHKALILNENDQSSHRSRSRSRSRSPSPARVVPPKPPASSNLTPVKEGEQSEEEKTPASRPRERRPPSPSHVDVDVDVPPADDDDIREEEKQYPLNAVIFPRASAEDVQRYYGKSDCYTYAYHAAAASERRVLIGQGALHQPRVAHPPQRPAEGEDAAGRGGSPRLLPLQGLQPRPHPHFLSAAPLHRHTDHRRLRAVRRRSVEGEAGGRGREDSEGAQGRASQREATASEEGVQARGPAAARGG